MANDDCNGSYFQVRGKTFYVCSWDHQVIEAEREFVFTECPGCDRWVAAGGVGECETVTKEFAMHPTFGNLELPSE